MFGLPGRGAGSPGVPPVSDADVARSPAPPAGEPPALALALALAPALRWVEASPHPPASRIAPTATPIAKAQRGPRRERAVRVSCSAIRRHASDGALSGIKDARRPTVSGASGADALYTCHLRERR